MTRNSFSKLFYIILLIIAAALCAFIAVGSPSAKSKCNVTGLNPKSHATLKRGLCDMSRHFKRQVKVIGSDHHRNCRTKNSKKGKKKSWHKYYRGCRAADVRVSGKSPTVIRNYWLIYTNGKPYLGGASAYGTFAHVDTRTSGARTW